jgi:hypothetical protein
MNNFIVRNKVFNTYPSIFHHPGKIGDGNRTYGIVQLKKIFFDVIGDSMNGYFYDDKEKIRLKIPTTSYHELTNVSSKLTIIFVSNLKEVGSGPRTLDYFGIPYRILGSKVDRWSNSLKIKFLNDHLSNIKTKYFMLLDSSDTFMINDLLQMIQVFEASNCAMLLNAGQCFWPHWIDEMKEYQSFCDQIGDEMQSRHRYVNTGALIAETEFYKEIAKTFDVDEAPLPGDDQSAFYPLYKKYYPRIQLDYYCKIFQCEFDEELLIEFPDLPWHRKQIIHSKTPLYPILRKYAAMRRNQRRAYV